MLQSVIGMQEKGWISGTSQRAAHVAHAKSTSHSRRSTLINTIGAAPVVVQLLKGSSALAAEPLKIPVTGLSVFQKADQKTQILERAQKFLRAELTGADAPLAMKLLLNEASTYDRANGTGGVDGSIFLSSEEAGRPYNKDLAPLIARLRAVKEKLDEASAKAGQGPLSYADLEVLAAKVAVQADWVNAKAAKTRSRGDAEVVSTAFGSPFDIRIGRVDRADAPARGSIPQEGDSVESITDFYSDLNNPKPGSKGGFFSPKPPFWEKPLFAVWTAAASNPSAEEERFAASSKLYAEIKKDFDVSRRTITRTNYEADFADYFNALANTGASFDPLAYLYELVVDLPRRL